MNLLIKNKLTSLRGSSAVTDENGQPAFEVKGRLFSITRKKTVCTLNGEKLYKVRNKFFNFFIKSAFVYDASGKKIAQVKKKFITHAFVVKGYKDEISIRGNIIGFNFDIVKNGNTTASISRNLTVVTDSFNLNTSEEDAAFNVALVIAIDNIYDKK